MVVKQYDVCENRNASTASDFPFLVVLQSDRLAKLATVFVAPMTRSTVPSDIGKLNPRIDIEGEAYFVIMQEMAAVLRRGLGKTHGNASRHHTAFVAAIDLIFTGI